MILAGIASALAGLCYAEFASTVPIAGSRLHLRLRDARRVRRVDHRLGPDPRVRARRRDRRGRLVAATSTSFLHDFSASQIPAAVQRAPGTLDRSADGVRPTAIINLPAVLITVARHGAARSSASSESAHGQRRHRRRQGGDRADRDHRRLRRFINPANWHAVHPGRTPATLRRATAGAAILRRRPASSSSPTSASTRCRPRRRKRRTRRRDMPIGILGSLVVCTVLYVLVSRVLVGLVPYKRCSASAGADGRWRFAPREVGVGRLAACCWRCRCSSSSARSAGLIVGDGGDDARPAARLLVDGQRRPAAAVCARRFTRVPDARTSRPSSPASSSALVGRLHADRHRSASWSASARCSRSSSSALGVWIMRDPAAGAAERPFETPCAAGRAGAAALVSLRR